MYEKHELDVIGFDRTTVFADGGIGSMPVLPDDDDEDGDN